MQRFPNELFDLKRVVWPLRASASSSVKLEHDLKLRPLSAPGLYGEEQAEEHTPPPGRGGEDRK